MKLQDGQSYLKLEVTEQLPLGTQRAGDTQFLVRVRMANHDTTFTAESRAWVDGGALAGFARDLRRLDDARQGSSGFLSAMSADEFRMEIRSTDHAGHMGVFGWVAHHCYGGVGGPNLSKVTFGIPFDPSELPSLVREFERLAAESGAEPGAAPRHDDAASHDKDGGYTSAQGG
jgi:hypothetical protein